MKMAKVISQAMKANKTFSFDLRGPARHVIAEWQDEKWAEGSGVDSIRSMSGVEKPVHTLLVLTGANLCQVSIHKKHEMRCFENGFQLSDYCDNEKQIPMITQPQQQSVITFHYF